VYICTETNQPSSWHCPNCFKDTCHILITSEPISFIEICNNCKHFKSLPNPSLNKKIIYLDHFCIDNIGKIRVGKSFSHAIKYEKIDKQLQLLVKRQLIVCPNSGFHDLETSFLSDQEHRKRTGNVMSSLACGTRFKDADSIVEQALACQKENAILTPDKILYGELNEFCFKKFEISLSIRHVDGKFRSVFAKKISEYLKEGAQLPATILKKLIDEYKNIILIKEISSPHLKRLLENSEDSILQTLPMFRILAGMLPKFSQDFAKGRKEDLNKGMAVDLMMIAHILPYVDAMFIDSEAFACLQASDKEFIPSEYKERAYSLKGHGGKNDINAFIDFLKQIELSEQELCCGAYKFKLEQVVKAYNENKSDNSLRERVESFINKEFCRS
jgi:hypothetical protein